MDTYEGNFAKCDVDEQPTNHLDEQNTALLIEKVKNYNGTIIKMRKGVLKNDYCFRM